jgi:RNase H-fold protein (predicted Holliday junction resolvase)
MGAPSCRSPFTTPPFGYNDPDANLKWAKGLAARAGKPVVFVDERLSSFAAEQRLNERKRAGERMTRGGKKKQLDAVAAAMFLQEFLDGKLPSIEVAE